MQHQSMTFCRTLVRSSILASLISFVLGACGDSAITLKDLGATDLSLVVNEPRNVTVLLSYNLNRCRAFSPHGTLNGVDLQLNPGGSYTDYDGNENCKNAWFFLPGTVVIPPENSDFDTAYLLQVSDSSATWTVEMAGLYAPVTLTLRETGVTLHPGDRLTIDSQLADGVEWGVIAAAFYNQERSWNVTAESITMDGNSAQFNIPLGLDPGTFGLGLLWSRRANVTRCEGPQSCEAAVEADADLGNVVIE
jgi:hypothetical protein